MPADPAVSRRRRTVIVATDDAFLCSWIVFAIRATGCRAVVVTEPAALFDAVARRAPAGLVLGESLRGVPAEALIAMVRTVGLSTPAIVLGPFDPDELRVASRALQPLELVTDPLDGVALNAALRQMLLVGAASPAVTVLPYAGAASS